MTQPPSEPGSSAAAESDSPSSATTADDRLQQIVALRRAAADIMGRADLKPELAATADGQRPTKRKKAKPVLSFDYARMPYGENWLDDLPAGYVDGQQGFDIRIARELAAVGIRCYTLDDLANGLRTIPPAIPIFVDWLENIDERIPGDETPHKSVMRTCLICNLIDPAAKGNRRAIDALQKQYFIDPPLAEHRQFWISRALLRICEKSDYSLVVDLLRRLPPGTPKAPLLDFLARYRTAEAIDIAVENLGDPTVRTSAIAALVRMKATGMREKIAPYLDDPNINVRKQATKAMAKLPL